MKLILTREVNKLGNAGDVVTVKDGYARNFLRCTCFSAHHGRGYLRNELRCHA